jgi:hypothetical protein
MLATEQIHIENATILARKVINLWNSPFMLDLKFRVLHEKACRLESAARAAAPRDFGPVPQRFLDEAFAARKDFALEYRRLDELALNSATQSVGD